MATRALSNGAIQDLVTGRIVSGATLTRDTARDLVAKRIAKKRERIEAGANAAIQAHPDFKSILDGTDLDWVEAGAQAVMTKTLNEGDERAFKVLVEQAGLLDADNSQRAHEPPSGAIALDAAALLELADMLAQRREQITAQARAIDAE